MLERDVSECRFDFLHLLSCAFTGDVPDDAILRETDLDAIRKIARWQMLDALTYSILDRSPLFRHLSGEAVDAFKKDTMKSLRRILIFDTEFDALTEALEENGIRYAPVKGQLIHALYPQHGTRECNDIDIFCDAKDRERVRSTVTKGGFEPISVGKGDTDCYQKPPVVKLEIHTRLLEESDPSVREGFGDIVSRLTPSDEHPYRLCFAPNDQYAYTIAHIYQHYVTGGTGFRSLADVYAILNAGLVDPSDPPLHDLLSRMGLSDFEAEFRLLAIRLFSGKQTFSSKDFSGRETELLSYLFSSGPNGLLFHIASRNISDYAKERKQSPRRIRFGYVFFRLFPDKNHLPPDGAFFSRHPILLPLYWLFRIVRKITARRKTIASEWKAIVGFQGQEQEERGERRGNPF